MWLRQENIDPNENLLLQLTFVKEFTESETPQNSMISIPCANWYIFEFCGGRKELIVRSMIGNIMQQHKFHYRAEFEKTRDYVMKELDNWRTIKNM